MALNLMIEDTGTELPALRFCTEHFRAGIGETYFLEIWQEASDYFRVQVLSMNLSENMPHTEETDETIGTYSTLLEALAAAQEYAHEQEL